MSNITDLFLPASLCNASDLRIYSNLQLFLMKVVKYVFTGERENYSTCCMFAIKAVTMNTHQAYSLTEV